MTRETFEKKFAELCEENGVAFLCRSHNYAVNLEDVMIGLSKFVEEDGYKSYLRGRNDALAEMAEVIERNKKETIEKACEWIKKHFPGNGYVNAQKEFHYYNVDIFRRAMED